MKRRTVTVLCIDLSWNSVSAGRVSQLASHSIQTILKEIHLKAPPSTAERWDNVGLMLGDPGWRTRGAVISMDLTEQAIEQALQRKFNLIINHHPCLFPKAKNLGSISPGKQGSLDDLIFQCLQKSIAVVSCHTNFDRSALEVVDRLCKGLGAEPQGRLLDRHRGVGELKKLVLNIAEEESQPLIDALYSEVGAQETADLQYDGWKLEFTFPKGFQGLVQELVQTHHPDDLPLFDLYSVEQGRGGNELIRGIGYGFWGDFPKRLSFSEVAQRVKRLFTVKGFRVTEPVPKAISRIAFSPGAGSDFVASAISHRCDLFITGEVGYHDALMATRSGMTLLELGHRESEKMFLEVMSGWIKGMGLETKRLNIPTQKLRMI